MSLFTEQEYQKVQTAMKSGKYQKCSKQNWKETSVKGVYSYCSIGLASIVTGKKVEDFFNASWWLCWNMTVQNDHSDEKDFGRMSKWMSSNKKLLVT